MMSALTSANRRSRAAPVGQSAFTAAADSRQWNMSRTTVTFRPPKIASHVPRIHSAPSETTTRSSASCRPRRRASRSKRAARRQGHNLILRLGDHRDGLLRFTRDPTVPATNTAAERALRPRKVQQTISGSFRSAEGARHHAVLRTILDTARKQGWTRLVTPAVSPEALMGRIAAMESAPGLQFLAQERYELKKERPAGRSLRMW